MKNIKKMMPRILIIILFFLSIIIAITNMEKPIAEKYNGPVTQYINFKINDCDLWVDTYNNNVYYDVVTLNSEVENSIYIPEFEGYKIFINNNEVTQNSIFELKLDNLSKTDFIELKFVELSTAIERKVFINTLPSIFNMGQVFSNNPEDGFYYFNVDDYVFKMNTKGEIVYWRQAGGNDKSLGGCDFKRTEVDGKVYYSFLFGNGAITDYGVLSGVGYGRMQALVMDQNYKVIDVVAFLVPYDDVGEGAHLENHQFTILGDKHYLLSSYIGKKVTNIPNTVAHEKTGTRVVATVIQEIKDGQVLFHWDSTDYPELYELSTEGNDYYNTNSLWADYAHFNSIVIDPKDNNFICSFRNLDTVIKLDRKTGDILWKLGGKGDDFNLNETQLFSKQHDAKITADGAITIFNNGNISVEETNNELVGHTSIMKFFIDEKEHKLLSFSEYKLDKSFSPFMGSAQEISENLFVIGWGYRQTSLPLFSEIDFNTGKVLFEFVRPINTSTGVSPNSYKVYKFDN